MEIAYLWVDDDCVCFLCLANQCSVDRRYGTPAEDQPVVCVCVCEGG